MTFLFLIKELDTRIVLDEVMEFIPNRYKLYKEQLPNVEPLKIKIERHSKPEYTKQWYLRMCKLFNIEG